MKCGLCGKSCEQTEQGHGWYTHSCSNCFFFRFYENVIYYNPNKVDLRSLEYTKDLKKRWYIIYNFLLRSENPKEFVDLYGNKHPHVYFIFGYFDKNGNTIEPTSLNHFMRMTIGQGFLADNEINMLDIIDDYPKTRDQKMTKILENLYIKYGTKHFTINKLDDGLVYDEGDRQFYMQALQEKGYIATSGDVTTVTLKGMDFLESQAIGYKPSAFTHVTGSDRKYVDSLLQAHAENESSSVHCVNTLRKLLEDILSEKHNLKKGNLSAQIGKFKEKEKFIGESIGLIRLMGKTTAHTKPIEPTKEEATEAVKIMEALLQYTFPICASIDISKLQRFKQ